jgi:MFS family permease
LLVTLALGVFAGALDLGILSPALPALAHTFAIPGRHVAWVFTLYLFANVVSIPVMTKLSDVYGRRPIYIAGVATKAWSQNLGHKNVLTTFSSYGDVGRRRQAAPTST